MANLAFAPEEDDFDNPLAQDSGPTGLAGNPGPLKNARRLHLDFDPRKIGFGIVSPWPGSTPERTPDDTDILDVTGIEEERR
jgi:hypothetical protein